MEDLKNVSPSVFDDIASHLPYMSSREDPSASFTNLPAVLVPRVKLPAFSISSVVSASFPQRSSSATFPSVVSPLSSHVVSSTNIYAPFHGKVQPASAVCVSSTSFSSTLSYATSDVTGRSVFGFPANPAEDYSRRMQRTHLDSARSVAEDSKMDRFNHELSTVIRTEVISSRVPVDQ